VQLAAVRKRAGVTQQELARRLRKPQSFVSAYENGQRRLDLLELSRVAQALQADPQVICASIFKAVAGKTARRERAVR
jgi:transcriptional regulator with XRE-family HTH domain